MIRILKALLPDQNNYTLKSCTVRCDLHCESKSATLGIPNQIKRGSVEPKNKIELLSLRLIVGFLRTGTSP
jgi:hypothetical protein